MSYDDYMEHVRRVMEETRAAVRAAAEQARLGEALGDTEYEQRQVRASALLEGIQRIHKSRCDP